MPCFPHLKNSFFLNTREPKPSHSLQYRMFSFPPSTHALGNHHDLKKEETKNHFSVYLFFGVSYEQTLVLYSASYSV